MLPASVTIDYGDGRTYTDDDQHLGAVFAHTHAQDGTFRVTARLTDAAGQVTESSCSYSWAAPAVVERSGASSSSGGGSASGSTGGGGGHTGGGSDDYYTNSDGDLVHRPEAAPSAPDGASAQCEDGTWSFSKHRSGTCSGHGGVQDWL